MGKSVRKLKSILLNDPEQTIYNCSFVTDAQSQAPHTNSLAHDVLKHHTNTEDAIH